MGGSVRRVSLQQVVQEGQKRVQVLRVAFEQQQGEEVARQAHIDGFLHSGTARLAKDVKALDVEGFEG